MTSHSKAASPPTNSDLESRKNSPSQSQLPLLDSLNDFARLISSAASLNVRRDLSKQQAVGQQKERDRQSKFKYSFLTLIEDAESRAEGAEKVSMGIEKQIDLSSQAQSKIAMTLAAQLQKTGVSDALPGAHDRGRCKEDFADLKADLRAARKKIDYLDNEAIMPDELHRKVRGLATKDELRGLATRDEIRGLGTKDDFRGLVSRDELRRVATDEVRKHVAENLLPTEKKLASLTVEDANLSQKIKGIEAVTQKHREIIEEQHQQQAPRFSRLETSLNDMQMGVSRLDLTVQAQQQDYATFKIDLGAQDTALSGLNAYVRRGSSNNELSLDTIIARNSNHVQLLQQDFEKLDKAVRQTQEFQAASKSSHPVSDPSSITVDTEIQEDVKRLRRELDALMKSKHENFNLIRNDLDVIKADQEKVLLIRADLDSLINEERLKDLGVSEEFELVEKSLNKQLEDLARLQQDIRLVKQSQVSQTIPNHPLTPPFASASTSPCLSDHQKLRDVEIALKDLAKTTQGLELFVNHQQQKFDGLSSDRVVQSMIHQMQQMYPQHPGNLFDQVTQIFGKQAKIDSYLSTNLKDRLMHIDSQIAARVDKDSKFEEATRFATETRTFLLTTINSLKLDIDGLKGAALNNRPQNPSDYGNRIDELVDRMTAVEARYVKAIGDFQTNQTNLAKQFNQLRYQNGVEAMRSTLEELTARPRGSKSVEPNGITISSENCNNSDGSDTSQSTFESWDTSRQRRAPFLRAQEESTGLG